MTNNTYEIGQTFEGAYPPEAAIWCNENGAYIGLVDGIYQIIAATVTIDGEECSIDSDKYKCYLCYNSDLHLTACSTCTIGTLAEKKVCKKSVIKSNRDAKYSEGIKCTIDEIDYYIKADSNTLAQSSAKDNSISKGTGTESQKKSWVFDGIYVDGVVTLCKTKVSLATSNDMSQLMANIGDYFERMQQHYGDLIIAVQDAATVEAVQACSTSFSTVSNDVTPS